MKTEGCEAQGAGAGLDTEDVGPLGLPRREWDSGPAGREAEPPGVMWRRAEPWRWAEEARECMQTSLDFTRRGGGGG